jgi:hypothetical protein
MLIKDNIAGRDNNTFVGNPEDICGVISNKIADRPAGSAFIFDFSSTMRFSSGFQRVLSPNRRPHMVFSISGLLLEFDYGDRLLN